MSATLTHRMQEDMQLRGFAPRTQDSYLRAVHGLAQFCGRPSDALDALTEGLALTIADIDSQRMVVRVRQGKGGRDRYVPLADRTLTL